MFLVFFSFRYINIIIYRSIPLPLPLFSNGWRSGAASLILHPLNTMYIVNQILPHLSTPGICQEKYARFVTCC
jgi:hypothetical protein